MNALRNATLILLLALWSPVIQATGLHGYIDLVESNVVTFDPVAFGPGPNVDVYHFTVCNGHEGDATSLSLQFFGEFQNFLNIPLAFQDSTALPTLGPHSVAETFFVLPEGTSLLDVGTVDSTSELKSNYTVAGTVALAPAGERTVLAVLSVPTGAAAPTPGITQAAIAGEWETIFFYSEHPDDCVPEPSTALLCGLAMAGYVARRRNLIQ